MRILVVDDDRDIRETLKTNLQADCFVVDTAGDGQEGSYLGRVHNYDAIVLDEMMPKKTGLVVCQEIRSVGKTTPIIVLSAKKETDDKIMLLNAGADDYISKPFEYKELHSRIRAILRRPALIKDQVLRVDDLVIDTMSHKARRGEKEIYLTKKEFALAEYLMRHAGHTLSRATLMEHVWDDDVDPFSNTIEAHILNLRKKIDIPGSPKLIHTIPGRGYMIE